MNQPVNEGEKQKVKKKGKVKIEDRDVFME
jgi:hypothetical protein